MSALVKAQLLKHLSKFVKNLSADHLTLKLLQGAGDIENIELNEELLSSTLGLPPWLRLTRAHCNRMSIRLHWTRLTSEPIQIYLDVVYIDIEAAEPKAAQSQQEKQQQASNSAVLNSFRMPYGFINKAVDGIALVINTVKVQFKAGTFFASLELSHVTLQSVHPDWSRDVKHLKNTRIKNTVIKQVMLFKLVRCNTLRLETSEMAPENLDQQTPRTSPKLTPFRVIINKLAVKIQFKRSLADSSLLFTKLQVEVDDVLSVLTDAQAQVGLRFINHLQRLSAGSSVELAAKKAALARALAAGVVEQPNVRSNSVDSAISATTTLAYHKTYAYFISHDFGEHSTHIKLARIDLHLVAERASSCCNKETLKMLDPILIEGAVRISLENLCFNVYPAHILGADHKGWPRYQRLFRNARTHLDNFQGCFEAIGYGSIDAVRLYAANLPHEHNPNQMCIAICGAGKWPAVYFDSSQVVSEKDLSILDSRNAVRISRVTVNFHLPTLLYLIVMAQDARHLFKVAEDLDLGSTANRCTRIELCEFDVVYMPQVPKQINLNVAAFSNETSDAHPTQPPSRPVVMLSIANISGQLVEQPKSALTEPTFSENVEISETELYSFLHSFLLNEQTQKSLSAEDFEAKCSSCCLEIEANRRTLWHWQLSCIFARTVTAADGDIPLLYLPKISGFIPQTKAKEGKLNVMLKCDPVEGPIHVFAERAQFDELQEMLSVFQKLATNVQKSTKIFESLSEQNLSSGLEPLPQTRSHILFMAPLISIRLLLPAVPPLVVPLTASVATQTDETPPSYVLLTDDVPTSTHLADRRCSLPDNGTGNDTSEDQRPLLSTEPSASPFSPPDDGTPVSQELFGNDKLVFEETSPGRSMSNAETISLLDENSASASNTVSSSSSSENMTDFVVVKTEDQYDEDDAADLSQPIPNPLDPSSMNFGLQGGAQEVVSVQLLIEGTTVSVEASTDQAIPAIELRFDRIGPIHKPRVLPRCNVYSSYDVPVSLDDVGVKRAGKRLFRATVSHIPSDDAEPPRQCIEIWLPAEDALPLVSMSAINALAHFMSPDSPVTENTSRPPVIKIHTYSNVQCRLKMDTPNVFDHLPQDLIHFIPPPSDDDKLLSLSVSSPPLLITRDEFSLSIAPASSLQQVVTLEAEIARLKEENRLLKSHVK